MVLTRYAGKHAGHATVPFRLLLFGGALPARLLARRRPWPLWLVMSSTREVKGHSRTWP